MPNARIERDKILNLIDERGENTSIVYVTEAIEVILNDNLVSYGDRVEWSIDVFDAYNSAMDIGDY